MTTISCNLNCIHQQEGCCMFDIGIACPSSVIKGCLYYRKKDLATAAAEFENLGVRNNSTSKL